MTFEEPYNGCPDCHECERERLQQQAEIERLRTLLLSIYARAMAARIAASSSPCFCEYQFAEIAMICEIKSQPESEASDE